MRLDKNSIGVKLWLYFVLFASIILTALWLLQIVFMQSFYEGMKTDSVAKAADKIIELYGKEGFSEELDRITFHNSILVFITDNQGSVIYTSDEHGGGSLEGLKKPTYPINNWIRPLPSGFNDFLEKISQSDSDSIHYILRNQSPGASLIYGAKMKDAVLYISTPLEPVDTTTDILRTQLIYVTFASLILSVVIAFFITRKIAKPFASISRQAASLAKGGFEGNFEKGFCSEIDQLADTLDHAASELSKVEKLRRELIANISHDLRTPLTMIKAYAEMIRDISGDNKEKREANLAIIEEEADRLTKLVNDLLKLSVIQSGNETIELKNLNISELTNKVISHFEPVFEHEGIEIEKIIEPDQYIQGDERKLTQVLYNLIANAMDHIGDNLKISVKLFDLGGSVRLEVTDYGEGIPEDELQSVWKRYYKSKKHRLDSAGTGLGLSIVRGILKLHGASFGVKSSLGSGSTFWFEIKK